MTLSRWLIPALVLCLSPGALAMNKQHPTAERQRRDNRFQNRQSHDKNLRVDTIRVTRHKAEMSTSIWRVALCGAGSCYLVNSARSQKVNIPRLPYENLPIGRGAGTVVQGGGRGRGTVFGFLPASKPGDVIGVYGYHNNGKRDVLDAKPITTFTLPEHYAD
jgi:hypothetical protein